MGSLRLPASGFVYVDANVAVYTVENHPVYGPLCAPLWQAVAAGTLTVLTSELTLLETLIAPLRSGDTALTQAYEALFQQPGTALVPITRDVLREAARLRALIPALRTPDALHAATALLAGCALFVTNDTGFRRVPGLPLTLLDNVLAAP